MTPTSIRRKPKSPIDWLGAIEGDSFEVPVSAKHIISYNIDVAADFVSRVREIKRARRTIIEPARIQVQAQAHMPANRIYPPALIRWFAAGLIGFLIGIVMLIISAFVRIEVLNLAAAILLAFGSIVVVLTLLRGQGIDERAL